MGGWVWNWISRETNKCITRSYGTNSEQSKEIPSTFVNGGKDYVGHVRIDNTFNYDESGFNLKLPSGCTVALQESKTVTTVLEMLYHALNNISLWKIAFIFIDGFQRAT